MRRGTTSRWSSPNPIAPRGLRATNHADPGRRPAPAAAGTTATRSQHATRADNSVNDPEILGSSRTPTRLSRGDRVRPEDRSRPARGEVRREPPRLGLPRWRGRPINRAVMAGDPTSGVSVISLADRMDAGAIHATRETAIVRRRPRANSTIDQGSSVPRSSRCSTDSPKSSDHGPGRTARHARGRLSRKDATVDFSVPAETVQTMVMGSFRGRDAGLGRRARRNRRPDRLRSTACGRRSGGSRSEDRDDRRGRRRRLRSGSRATARGPGRRWSGHAMERLRRGRPCPAGPSSDRWRGRRRMKRSATRDRFPGLWIPRPRRNGRSASAGDHGGRPGSPGRSGGRRRRSSTRR